MSRFRDTWKLVEKALDSADRVLLYGPPGTGKTTSGVKAGSPSNVFKVTLHEEMAAAELTGHFVPEGDKFVWHDGIAGRAWKTGGRLVLDEIDRGSGDVLTVLYAILDDPDVAMLTLASGETIYPRAGFKVVATMNGNPGDLPDALRDRFQVAIEVTNPHPKAIESLPEDLRNAAASSFEQGGSSIRSWKSFGSLRAAMGDEHAAQAVFGQRAEEVLDSLRVAQADA